MRVITMGSLFDGIGGFPLAAIHNGVVPLWASEIEPFPIRVTRERLPGMLHYGDITKLRGDELPPVDIICGGSPCQDLSVAGARAGLAGERSGLFMEQIRIIKEMRDADVLRGRTGIHVRPRFMCWENVPGAFSSGQQKGDDFRVVLEETLGIGVSGIHVPENHPWGWRYSGAAILGDFVSLTEAQKALRRLCNGRPSAAVESQVLSLLNCLAAAPEQIKPQPQTVNRGELAEMERRFSAALTTSPVDEDGAKEFALRLAGMQYSAIGNSEYESQRLRHLFTGAAPMAEINVELLKNTVAQVYVKKGQASLLLKNGQIIERRA